MATKTRKLPMKKREKLDLRRRTKITVEPVTTATLPLEEKIKRFKKINEKLKARRTGMTEGVKVSSKGFSVFKVFGF